MKAIFEKKGHFGLSCARVCGFLGFPPMFHPHGELLYVIKGNINTVIDGQEHTLKEGEISLVFPYITHSYDNAPDAEAIILLFDTDVVAFDKTLIKRKPTVTFTDGRFLFSLIDRAVTMAKIGKIKTALGYVNAILGELLEVIPTEETDGVTEDITVRILEYCTNHYTEDISIKSVSDALYISQSYVTKIFSNKLKYSFREYVNTLRIEKAKHLLCDGNKRIVDIMLECGFQNQSSFNRIFKDLCGVSPFNYRKYHT